MTYPNPSPFEAATVEIPADCNAVQVSLASVLPLLVDAVRGNRGWLEEFLDEEVVISHDLYQMLRFYAHAQHPAAVG